MGRFFRAGKGAVMALAGGVALTGALAAPAAASDTGLTSRPPPRVPGVKLRRYTLNGRPPKLWPDPAANPLPA